MAGAAEAVDAEVHQHRAEAAVAAHEHHVVGAEITVREPGGVHRVEALADGLEHPARLVDVHGPGAADARREELPVDVLRGDVGAAVGEQARGDDALHGGVVHLLERALRQEEALERAAVAGAALPQHLERRLVALGTDGEVDGSEALVVGLLQDLVPDDHLTHGEVVRGAALVDGSQPGLRGAVGEHDGVGEGLVEVIAQGPLGERSGEGRAVGLGGDVVGFETEEVARELLQGVEVVEALEFDAQDLDWADGCRGCHDG